MVEHRRHAAGLEYDASAGWKPRKLGCDIRRRRRHLRLVDDSAVSSHDANLRFRHRDVQSGKILHCRSPLCNDRADPIGFCRRATHHYPMLKKKMKTRPEREPRKRKAPPKRGRRLSRETTTN